MHRLIIFFAEIAFKLFDLCFDSDDKLLPAAAKPEKKFAPTSPPKFVTLFDEYIRTQEGDTLNLECEVAGNPPPEVTWTTNDKKVENSETNYDVSF